VGFLGFFVGLLVLNLILNFNTDFMEYHQLLLFLLLFFCHFQLIKTAPSFDDNEFAEFEIADEEPQVSFANNDVKEEHKVDEIKADAVREAPKQVFFIFLSALGTFMAPFFVIRPSFLVQFQPFLFNF